VHYLIVVTPSFKPLGFAADLSEHHSEFDLGTCRVTVATDPAAGGAPAVEWRADLPALTITEGRILSAGGPGPLQSGCYNQLHIDAGGVMLHSDTLAVLPCYYATAGGVLYVSNSLRLLRQATGAAADELGVAETFLLSHGVWHERTLLDGVHRVAGGTLYRFTLPEIMPPQVTRLATTWTRIIDEPVAIMVERICDLWQAAVARAFDDIDAPIGLMLSGGLDSRLVAGGLASRGRDIVALTHGDPNSDEMETAGQVAAAVGARHFVNAIDDSFSFEQLALEGVHQSTEALYNPMWHSSALCLAAEGVAHFTTGAGCDVLLGGERLVDPRRRFARNVRLAVLGPSHRPRPADDAARQTIAAAITAQAKKRAVNYTCLLARPYRALVLDSLPAIRASVSARIAAIAASAPVSAAQVMERFAFENGAEQHSRLQERQLLSFGAVHLPTYDRDLLDYLTNLSPGAKCDHYLYYRVFRRLYPHLARLRVASLGNHIDRPQLLIEVERARRIMRQQRTTPWVNFNRWIHDGDRLAQYEALFLAQEGFFDADGVRAFFGDLRAGRRSLYDGNETLGFLNLAWLLDERRAAVSLPQQPAAQPPVARDSYPASCSPAGHAG